MININKLIANLIEDELAMKGYTYSGLDLSEESVELNSEATNRVKFLLAFANCLKTGDIDLNSTASDSINNYFIGILFNSEGE